ncbi:hypothetical protein [Rhizobium mongolense]|uniref:Uncharacterized protein n=1 Tax=Rhizobium mongolense TaxID=57676 RepID=A0A7W6RR38_9HYPH|nr:hypothetical protein [Rhizobium mongolense]MBB4277077.1 hypothetical protein [Rhizobium mongolense]
MTKKGQAKIGRGDAVGSTCLPQKILAAVIQNKADATIPAIVAFMLVITP